MNAPEVVFDQVPEDAWLPPRREFLSRLLGGAAATVVLPTMAITGMDGSVLSPPTGDGPLLRSDPADEAWWQLVKDQFPLRDDLVIMNAANLCPSPWQVQEAVFGMTRDVDADPSHANRGKFGGLRDEARGLLARWLGADTDEIVITRNTSEGNNVVISGLSLGPGDEVVIWDQNHPTCNLAWDVGARRHGYTVKRVSTPPEPESGEELYRVFRDALTDRTRVLAFSHVSNVSGVALPADRLCELARERGVMTLVDGAQTFGVEALDLHDMGCDFFTGSAHKWPMGPKETGVLYVSRQRQKDIWPLIVGIGWGEDDAARKYESLGQRDDARVSAVGKMVAFHEMIGKERVEARVRALAAEVKRQIASRLPGTRFHTPVEEELSLGVVVFAPPGVDLGSAMRILYEEHSVGCAVMRGDFSGIRLSPHIYNTMEDVERVVDAIVHLA